MKEGLAQLAAVCVQGERGPAYEVRRLARMQNENLASMVHDNPDRFVGLATVPLQDVGSAVKELEYAVRELDFRGVEINTNVFGLR